MKAAGALLLLAAGALAGCEAASRPITIAQALDQLQKQLRDAGAINPGVADADQLAAAARGEQCAAMSADPEVPLLAKDITVTLSGSFTATGGFSVGNAALGTGLTTSATRGQTQQLTLPLTFVALTNIPDAIEADQLATITASMPAGQRRAAASAARRSRDALAARIDALVQSWTPALCAAQDRTRTSGGGGS